MYQPLAKGKNEEKTNEKKTKKQFKFKKKNSLVLTC